MVGERQRRDDPRASMPCPTRVAADRSWARGRCTTSREPWQSDFGQVRTARAAENPLEISRDPVMIRLRESPNFGDDRIAVREDGMKALALVDAPDHVCCRYRINAYAPALNAAGWELSFQAFSRGLVARLSQIAGAARFDSL